MISPPFFSLEGATPEKPVVLLGVALSSQQSFFPLAILFTPPVLGVRELFFLGLTFSPFIRLPRLAPALDPNSSVKLRILFPYLPSIPPTAVPGWAVGVFSSNFG